MAKSVEAGLAVGGDYAETAAPVSSLRDFWRQDRDLLAMRTFRYSIIYLFALFAGLAVDHAVQPFLPG